MKKLLALLICTTCVLSLSACGGTPTPSSSAASGSSSGSPSSLPSEAGDGNVVQQNLQIGQALGAAHGTKCFTTATVVMNGDVIVAAYLDEYQVMGKEGSTPVPNSDTDFGTAVTDTTKALVSKKVNNEIYSANMTKSGATISIEDNMMAIEKFVAGKTVAELETLLTGKSKEEVVEAVAGCTLVDADGYLKVIVDGAKAASTAEVVPFNGDTATLMLKKAEYAAHGTKSFATATVLMNGDMIVAAYIDEYQFMGEGTIGVPNSDVDFGKNFAEGKILGSKKVNNETYSVNMAKSGSTVSIKDNIMVIEKFVMGKTAAELEAFLADKTKEAVVEAVVGCTLVDTDGYLKAVIAATK